MRKLLPMLLFLSVPAVSFGQGSIVNDIALKNLVTGIAPAAGATVTVCTGAGTGIPCTPLATVYSDIALTVPKTNPLTADSNGYYSFFAAPGTYIVTVTGAGTSGRSITYTVPLSLSASTYTFPGQIQCKDLEATKCVDSANTQGWAGADIGGWINAAYAALPSTGGEIHVYNLGTSCMNFTTGISFATSGKYAKLVGHGTTTTTPSGGACLNWTPSTGTAINLDYVPINATTYPNQHGIRDLTLVNNLCITSGGCGGSAFGVQQGAVNWGASNAVFDHVGIIGFAFGYNNANTVNLPEITWLDPFFGSNVVAFTNGTNTNNTFLGGFFVGNATAIQSTATPGGEYQMDGVSFAVNNGPLLDFTRSTTRVIFSCFACHFEDSPVVNAGTPHFITGLVSARIYGGAMETDQASGTQDWFISIAAGGSLEVHGLDLFSAGKTFTQAFLLNTTARGNAQITNNNTTAFPTILGGAGAAGSILGQVATNTNAILQVNGSSVAGIFTGVNVTPVTVNTNTTGDQNLMALTITAGALNSLSRTLLIQLAGVYSTPAGSTAVLTHKLKLCTVSGCGSGTVITLVTWTTSALGAIQVTNNPYNATLNATTQTAGASAAFEAHGNLTIDLAALAAAAESIFADNNTATVGTIDSTAQLFLQHTVAFSAGSASNTDTDRQMIADTVD